MTTEYAAQKTKEILVKTQGQAKLAEQAIRALVQRDHAFLLSLVEPYLNGIIIHAIERARKTGGTKEPAAAKPLPKVQKPARPASAAPVGTGGMDAMMKAWAKSFEKGAPEAKPGAKKVSADHLAAMQSLIKKKI